MTLPPAKNEKRAVPVGGPRHYPVKTCEERGFCRVRDHKCIECAAVGDVQWERSQFTKEGDWFLELGVAVDELARKQIREYGMLFDADNGYPRTAAKHAGGND